MKISKTYSLAVLLLWTVCLRAGDEPPQPVKAFPDSVTAPKINKTIAYFRQIGEGKLENDVRIILPFLEQRFGIQVFDRKYANDPGNLPLLLRYFWIYEPGSYWDTASVVQRESTEIMLDMAYAKNAIDALTTYACLCDKIPPPADYAATLEWKAKQGGYELTHVALQYKNLYQKKCIGENEYALKSRYTARLLADSILLARPEYNAVYDLKIEAAVMLYYLDSDLVNEPAVQAAFSGLFAHQDASGGWRRGPDEVIAQHTSLLALWWLLEMKGKE